MAQKSKAASLTPDLLTSKTAPVQPAPRKQAADLSLAPIPSAGQTKSSETAAPAPAATLASISEPTPAPAKAKGKSGNDLPAPVPAKKSEQPVTEEAQIAARAAPPPSSPPASDRPAEAKPAVANLPEAAPSGATPSGATPAPATASGGDGKAAVANALPHDDVHLDYRIRIPVPLDPSEHLELTLAAARSGRSCQEIIVEALFRYLEDIAGPSNKSAAPGPDAQP